MMTKAHKPVALIILDGWGERAPAADNAISNANTPVWDHLTSTYTHTSISTSGEAVGLPDGQMGNSEVGHMNLGAGRIVYQNFTRINKSIKDKDFYENKALCQAIDAAVSKGKAVHLAGLLSPGGVHSHEEHIFAAVELAASRGANKIYIHAILDGRDMPPRSAQPSLKGLEDALTKIGKGQLVSVIGRYYAMDRDNRWNRIQAVYDMMTLGEASHHATSGIGALEAAYSRDEDDEFVGATSIHLEGEKAPVVEDGDSIIFMNFRPDRARELTRAFTEKESFDGFKRTKTPALSDFVMLTEFASSIDANCAYPPNPISNDLGEVISSLGKTQLRIAETEKYAHVTFFFSGGQEATYPGEERILIQSPDVATYDLQPEMSAPELTDNLVAAIKGGKHDLIICNYANGDMVGHTGKYDAAVKAVEAVDICLGRIVEALNEVGGECLITADHGNAEQMVNAETGQPLTSHTTGPVPLIYVNQRNSATLSNGSLCDIAPTLLNMMDLQQPSEMTGKTLVTYS
jgi:2,3-bisphosphoglycerate-independent phosphoglycerate mutase